MAEVEGGFIFFSSTHSASTHASERRGKGTKIFEKGVLRFHTFCQLVMCSCALQMHANVKGEGGLERDGQQRKNSPLSYTCDLHRAAIQNGHSQKLVARGASAYAASLRFEKMLHLSRSQKGAFVSSVCKGRVSSAYSTCVAADFRTSGLFHKKQLSIVFATSKAFVCVWHNSRCVRAAYTDKLR